MKINMKFSVHKKKFYWNTATLIVYGCVCATVQLTSCYRDV